jgi:beta-lactamase class A
MVKIITFFFLLILLTGVGYFLSHSKKTFSSESMVLPTPKVLAKDTSPTDTPQADAKGLAKVVQDSLKGTTGTYAVVIENYKTGEKYTLSEHLKFESASLYKLWVMGTVFDQIKQEKFKHDDVLSDEISHLNDVFGIDEEDAELTDGTISMTVDQALTQMITISHNYAAMLLTRKVGVSNIQAYIASHGLAESDAGQPPTTTASDIAEFYDDLYYGKLGSMVDTKAMLDLLKKQTLNNKIPADLPDGVVVAHKTGELGNVSHDAGIIYNTNGPYLFVMMSESTSPAGAVQRIADTSKAVYDYFQHE